MPTVNLKKEQATKSNWKERISAKGNKVYYRRWNNRFVNSGTFKNGHVYISVDGKLVQDHNIKFTNEEQLKKDIDIMLETLVIIGDD